MIRDVKNGLTPDRRSSGLRSVSSLSLATLPVVFDQSTAARWPFTYNYDVRLFVDARIVEISVRCQQLAIPSSDSGTACGNLVIARTCRRIGDRTFSVAAPRAWNTLSTDLKLLWSTESFRRKLKTFLFESVFGYQETC